MNEEEEEIINILEQNKIEQEKKENKNNNSYSNNSNNDNLLPIQMSYMEKLKGYKLTGDVKKFNYKGTITININALNINNNKENINNNTYENIFSLLPNINSFKILFLSDKNNKSNDFILDSRNILHKINKSDLNNNKESNEIRISENEIARITTDKCNIEIFKDNNKKPFQKLIGHDAKINQIILIKYRTFCTASDDNKIKLWELINGISEQKYYCKQTLKEHIKEVNDIIFMNDKLISCSNDNTIKVWNYDNDLGMSYIQTLNQHQNSVNSLLQLNNDTFISSDKSFLLNVWKIESFEKDNNNENEKQEN
jgi:WD40 repeat protein